MWNAFLIILAVAAPSQADRILCLFPHPGKSHFLAFQTLFESLSDRGHNLTVVSFFPSKDPPNNYRDISLVGLSKIYVEAIDLTMFETNYHGLQRELEEFWIMKGFFDLGLNLCEKILQLPSIENILTSNDKYDLIIVEYFNSDCGLGIAQHFDAPIVGLLSHQFLPWHYQRMGLNDNPSYVPNIFRFYDGPDLSFLARLENTFLSSMYKLYYRYYVQLNEQVILEKALGYKIPYLEDIALNTSLILVNTHHSLHGSLPTVPGVVETGGAHLKKAKGPLAHNIKEFIEGAEHGVILFSFGSMLKSSTMTKKKLDAFINTFSNLSQRVIMKWEDDIPGKPDNVLLVKWIPQYDILHHSNVVAFIAHGGLLGMSEAAHAGVPMLVVPVFGDQPGNARAAKNAGLAQVVPYRDITEENLRNALEIILTPASRESARTLSSVWRDRPMEPLDSAVYWIERVLRHGSARSQLASPARRLHFYQRALLDVAAVVAAFLIVSMAMLYYILGFAFKAVFQLLSRRSISNITGGNIKKVKRN